MLCPVVGNWLHHMNSTEFIHPPGSVWVGLKDKIVSFNMVLMFTRILIREALNLQTP
jgi:hypothetical protein